MSPACHPDRRHAGRGMCPTCYKRWWRAQQPSANPEPGMWRTGTPMRILDVLEADGGTLTYLGVAAVLDVPPDTARRALYRLRDKGRVQSRKPVPWMVTEWSV